MKTEDEYWENTQESKKTSGKVKTWRDWASVFPVYKWFSAEPSLIRRVTVQRNPRSRGFELKTTRTHRKRTGQAIPSHPRQRRHRRSKTHQGHRLRNQPWEIPGKHKVRPLNGNQQGEKDREFLPVKIPCPLLLPRWRHHRDRPTMIRRDHRRNERSQFSVRAWNKRASFPYAEQHTKRWFTV